MPPKMETDLIGIFYVHTLLTHSQSVCDSIHCYKPFLQDYCISISYAYSVCRLSIYATVKKPALFLLHYILFVQAISLISRIQFEFASHTGIICRLNSLSYYQLKYWVQATVDPLATTENTFHISLVSILQQLHIHISLVCLPEYIDKVKVNGTSSSSPSIVSLLFYQRRKLS